MNSGAIGVLQDQAVVFLPNSYGDVYGTGIDLRVGGGYMLNDLSEVRGVFVYQSADANLVRMLLDHGANPAAVDKQRWTPLDYAVSRPRSPSTPAEGTEDGTATSAAPEGGKHLELTPSPESSEAR